MTGVELIAAERARQVDVKGWTPEHDDNNHDADGALVLAAACYAAAAECERIYVRDDADGVVVFRDPWPRDLSRPLAPQAPSAATLPSSLFARCCRRAPVPCCR